MIEVKRQYNKSNGAIIVTNELIDFIKNQYEKGISQNDIAKSLNVGSQFIRKIMKSNNIYIRNDREQALKNKCNENYFHIIDTEEKAYWLGFIYADGYILSKKKHCNRKLGIAISTNDKDHLEKFKLCIDFTGEIKDYISNNCYNPNTQYSRILITSEILVEDLISKGCFEHKTDIIKFPNESQVPNNLIKHFIRGYLDGDGSITGFINEYNRFEPNIKIVGTMEFIEGIQRFLNLSLKIQNRFPERNKNNYTLTIGGRLQVINILNILYESSTIYLDRKYEKYKQICM